MNDLKKRAGSVNNGDWGLHMYARAEDAQYVQSSPTDCGK